MFGSRIKLTIRIAVFNDYPQNLRLIQEILTKKGFEVFAYQQNYVDLHDIEQISPQLIILAYVLGYDGDQLRIVDRLKALPATAGIPIIICTTGIIDTDGNTELAYIPVIPKPFDVSDLLAEVNRILYRPDGMGRSMAGDY